MLAGNPASVQSESGKTARSVQVSRSLYHRSMKHELMEILVCPLDKGELTLTVDREENGEIMSGSLRCQNCGETYPIEDGIPNMLPPDLRD